MRLVFVTSCFVLFLSKIGNNGFNHVKLSVFKVLLEVEWTKKGLACINENLLIKPSRHVKETPSYVWSGASISTDNLQTNYNFTNAATTFAL